MRALIAVLAALVLSGCVSSDRTARLPGCQAEAGRAPIHRYAWVPLIGPGLTQAMPERKEWNQRLEACLSGGIANADR